jgi:hypothetical protein
MHGTKAFQPVRHDDHMEIRHPIDGIGNFQAIADEIARYHVSWNPNLQSTQERSAALLASAMQFWGSGSVKGSFRTSWHRDGMELVVKTSWLPYWKGE